MTDNTPMMKITVPLPFAYDSANLYMINKEFQIPHILTIKDTTDPDTQLTPIPLNTFKFNESTKQNVAHITLTSNNSQL